MRDNCDVISVVRGEKSSAVFLGEGHLRKGGCVVVKCVVCSFQGCLESGASAAAAGTEQDAREKRHKTFF